MPSSTLDQKIRDALASSVQLRAWLMAMPNDSYPVGFAKAPYGCPIALFLNITVVKDTLRDHEYLFIADNVVLLQLLDIEDDIKIPLRGWLWTFRRRTLVRIIDEEDRQTPITRGRALQLLADAAPDPAAT